MSTDPKTWIAEQAAALNITPEIVEGIEAAGYQSKADFNHVTADHLMADVKGLKRPQANRILEAAGALKPAGAATGPTEIKVSLDQPVAKQQIEASLGELIGPGRVAAMAALRGLGVWRVVVDDKGAPVPSATFDYLADGAPAVKWWGDAQVVELDDVGTKRLHHPRTGRPISKADAVPWYELDREALTIAAAIYIEELDAGDSERTIFGYVKVKNSDVAQQAVRRLAASPDLRRRAEARVDGAEVGAPQHSPARGREAGPTRGGQSADDTGTLIGVPRHQAHYGLLVKMFSADELRRLVHYFDESMTISLPGGGVTLATLASDVVRLVEARGHANEPRWWLKMIGERSGRAAEIRAVAAMYGVNP